LGHGLHVAHELVGIVKEGMRTAMGLLTNVSTAELDRLFGESVDVSSHRIDATVDGVRPSGGSGAILRGLGSAPATAVTSSAPIRSIPTRSCRCPAR
jgi:hypothetical protein